MFLQQVSSEKVPKKLDNYIRNFIIPKRKVYVLQHPKNQKGVEVDLTYDIKLKKDEV